MSEKSQAKKGGDKAPAKKKTGLFVVGAGVAVLIAGYITLSMGSITVAPALIIGAFVVMAVGITLGWD